MKNKIVVYTSIFGPYDGLIPQKKIEGVDFICFTDQDFNTSPWKVVKCERKFEDSTRNARYYKVLPHKYLQDYEISIWIDGNFLIKNLRNELFEQLKEYPLIAFEHGWNCIYKECEGIIELGKRVGRFKDDPEVMKAQIERYRAEGFPENYGLCQSGIMIRNHHDEKLIQTMELWWSEIENGSKRDQLSMFYAKWKTGVNMLILPEDARQNKWFFMLGVHRKNYKWKLLRYKIKKFFGFKREYNDWKLKE
jgi:hypothetical protein